MRNFCNADIHNNNTVQDNGSNNIHNDNMEQGNGSKNDNPTPDKDKLKEEPAVEVNETIVPFFDSAFSKMFFSNMPLFDDLNILQQQINLMRNKMILI
jgi:hypothetical protein